MTPAEIAEELKNIKPFPNMQPEVFTALRGLLPMPAVELFVVRSDGSFALLERTGQFNGWAMPGGYIGFNENFEDACKRIAKKELDVDLNSIVFTDVFNWPESSARQARGHAISLLFKCTAESDSKIAKYFSSIPEGILKHHALMLDRVLR